MAFVCDRHSDKGHKCLIIFSTVAKHTLSKTTHFLEITNTLESTDHKVFPCLIYIYQQHQSLTNTSTFILEWQANSIPMF